jgi:hypothetical protein
VVTGALAVVFGGDVLWSDFLLFLLTFFTPWSAINVVDYYLISAGRTSRGPWAWPYRRCCTGCSPGARPGPVTPAPIRGLTPVRPAAPLPSVGRMTAMDARESDLKKDLDATLRARGELGEEYEAALIESFLEKVDQRIDDAVERRVRRQLVERQMAAARDDRSAAPTDSWGERFGFGIVSLVLAIPLSAIGGGTGHLPGLLAAWAGIVGVNVVQAVRTDPGLFRRRKPSPDDRREE